MTCRDTVSLGAYLLGALDPAERSAFEEHLTTCQTCKAELLRLAPLPGLLQRLTPDDYAAIAVDDAGDDIPDWLTADFPVEAELVEPLPQEPARPGWWRRHSLALAAAAAVVLLAVSGVVIFQPRAPETIASAPVTWSAVDPMTGVRGKVDLFKRNWGTEVRLSMEGVPAGHKICHLIVYSRSGGNEVAGKWTAGYYSAIAAVPGSTSIRLNDIERIEVMAGGGLLIGLHMP